MPNLSLPCCADSEPRPLVDLPHVYQFDFDLYQCRRCGRYWVYAWREGQGGWESVTLSDGEQMQTLVGPELRTFMKTWAASFQ
jgi:hypothetical protein